VTSAGTPQVQVQVCGPAEPHMTGTLQRGITLLKKKLYFQVCSQYCLDMLKQQLLNHLYVLSTVFMLKALENFTRALPR